MASLSGDSIIVNKDFIIEDNSFFKNYIIPSSPIISKSILIVLPNTLSGDSNGFRVCGIILLLMLFYNIGTVRVLMKFIICLQ